MAASAEKAGVAHCRRCCIRPRRTADSTSATGSGRALSTRSMTAGSITASKPGSLRKRPIPWVIPKDRRATPQAERLQVALPGRPRPDGGRDDPSISPSSARRLAPVVGGAAGPAGRPGSVAATRPLAGAGATAFGAGEEPAGGGAGAEDVGGGGGEGVSTQPADELGGGGGGCDSCGGGGGGGC